MFGVSIMGLRPHNIYLNKSESESVVVVGAVDDNEVVVFLKMFLEQQNLIVSHVSFGFWRNMQKRLFC